jgi:hypothetical protein
MYRDAPTRSRRYPEIIYNGPYEPTGEGTVFLGDNSSDSPKTAVLSRLRRRFVCGRLPNTFCREVPSSNV